jgi:hypothetical protein
MCDEKVGMCVRHKNSKEKALERERERERERESMPGKPSQRRKT